MRPSSRGNEKNRFCQMICTIGPGRLRRPDVRGVWLQAALMAALAQEQISLPAYAAAVVNLAARRHGHVSLTKDVLLEISLNDSDDLGRLRTILHYIGGKNAEITSHFVVVIDLISRLCELDLDTSPLRRRAATGITLEALLRNLDTDGHDWLRRVFRFMPRSMALRRYLLGFKATSSGCDR
jgi:hypothetical protein